MNVSTRRSLLGWVATLIGVVCASVMTMGAALAAPEVLKAGRVVASDERFHALVPADARIEKIAEGFNWSEGPVWVRDGGYLLFTDVPENTLYRWSEREGLSILLKPSGYVGPESDTLREAGANGLLIAPDGALLFADSGSRALARVDLHDLRRTTLVARYQGKRFNSPNDLVRHDNGTIYFTDPPFGLKEFERSPARELNFSGVFALGRAGKVRVIDDTLSFPNGVALSPDQRTLYVSNADGKRPIWMAYTLDTRGNVINKRLFADASDLIAQGARGLPDGMAVASDGTLFAAAPGGVLVFAPDGKRLGRIETGDAVSNCKFGDDGRTLYMTSHGFVARVRVLARGLGFEPRTP